MGCLGHALAMPRSYYSVWGMSSSSLSCYFRVILSLRVCVFAWVKSRIGSTKAEPNVIHERCTPRKQPNTPMNVHNPNLLLGLSTNRPLSLGEQKKVWPTPHDRFAPNDTMVRSGKGDRAFGSMSPPSLFCWWQKRTCPKSWLYMAPWSRTRKLGGPHHQLTICET